MMSSDKPTLAFCNDIDFADWNAYQEVHHVLEQEFGLVAGDSFWLFDPAGSDMALFKDSLQNKGPKHDELLEDIVAGRLDVMHSAGNFSLTNTDQRPNRHIVAEGLAYLSEHAKVPNVWTNHGDYGDITNIGGAQPVYQKGDLPSEETYILDLLLQHGVQYFWLDHFSSNDFVFSRTSAGKQPLLVKESTRSGLPITCFRRYRGALPKAPTALTLHEQLTEENLEMFTSSHGVCVVYQHWGAHRKSDGVACCATSPVFPPEGIKQLKRLSRLYEQRQIEIATLGAVLESCQP